MIKIVSLLLILMLVGCASEPIFINRTIEVEVIKECPNVCPMNVCEYDCPDCICNYVEPECKTTIKTIVAEGCTKKLQMCNIIVDDRNERLTNCQSNNNTKSYQLVKDNLTDCIKDRDKYKEELEEIKDVVN